MIAKLSPASELGYIFGVGNPWVNQKFADCHLLIVDNCDNVDYMWVDAHGVVGYDGHGKIDNNEVDRIMAKAESYVGFNPSDEPPH